MKNRTKILITVFALTFAVALPTFAMDSHHGHGGADIHTSMVDGRHFSYELIDMREKMKGMKNMPEMKDTHHLMVHVKDAAGQKVDKAKVGFLIENPDGSTQKKMAMGMAGGFGADVNLEKKGVYTIKTKVMAGETKLMDSFEYEVK